MLQYHYENDHLFCEDVELQDIVEQYGTPTYVYSKRSIINSFELIVKALSDLDSLICYAVKANNHPEVLKILAQHGCGADVVSKGEMKAALQAGIAPDKIVFAGVGKSDEEIRLAISEQIYSLHVESLEELSVVDEIARSMNVCAAVGMRINPDIDIQGHPYIATGGAEAKFGIQVPDLMKIVSELSSYPNVSVKGLHIHLGSQINNSTPYLKALALLVSMQQMFSTKGTQLEYLDIGGGLGVDYHHPMDSGWVQNQIQIIRDIAPALGETGCRILFEPGRFIIANSGVLLTRVLFVKQTGNKRFVVSDAGMTELIRPALYNAYHEIVPLRRRSDSDFETVDVVGPICESGDFLARNRKLQQVKRGEGLAIMTAGAYGFSLASNYNSRGLPAEVLVDSKAFREITKRQEI